MSGRILSHTQEKETYKREIDKLINEITIGKETFDFEIYFSEIFHRKAGFDAVIGNPPWISNDSLEEPVKAALRSAFTFSTESRFDLSCPFVELSMRKLMAKKGTTAFVLPEHLWLGEYFISFRKHTYKHWQEVTSLKEGCFDAVNNPASMLILTSVPSDRMTVGRSLPEGTIVRTTQSKHSLENEIQLGSRGQEIHTFKLFFDLDYLALKEKMTSKKWHFLDAICVITDGVQTANVLSELMTDQTPPTLSKYRKALRKGKAIPHRYGRLKWDGWWILKPEHAAHLKRPGFSYDSPKRMKCFLSSKKIVIVKAL